MAKMKKYPKQPKANASEATWKNWEERCKVVAKYNSDLKKAPAVKRAIKERVQKLKMK